MKNFYEMLQILNENRIDGHHWSSNTWFNDYGAGEASPYESFSDTRIVLGEDQDEPFSAVIDIEDGDWKFRKGLDYGLYARGYVLTGKENPASEPKQDPASNSKCSTVGYGCHSGGVDFKNPGRKLENMHEPLKSQAKKWLDDTVVRYIDNRIEYERDYDYGHDYD